MNIEANEAGSPALLHEHAANPDEELRVEDLQSTAVNLQNSGNVLL